MRNGQVEADAASLPGTYNAWISEASASPAQDFTKSPSRYILPNRKVVADSWDDLTCQPDAVPPCAIDTTGLSQLLLSFTVA